PSSPSSNRSPTSDRHLSPQHQDRKHSINDGDSHQQYDRPVPVLKQIVDSKSLDDQHVSESGTLRSSQCQKSPNSSNKQDLKKSPTPPPPLPPKTYNRCSNSTTTSSSSSLNNSGRSSIASNTSSIRMKDCDSGFGSSTPGMPSNSILYQQPTEKQDPIDLANRNSGTIPTTVKTQKTVSIVSNTQDTGYSQITLRSKKNSRRNRTRTIQDSVADDENNSFATASSSQTIVGTDGNNEDERCSSHSPPPLPALDSFLCSMIEPQQDAFKNEEEKENL
ncbi:hypothetical protein BLA29_008207, partial [Euroglyphus maynei]